MDDSGRLKEVEPEEMQDAIDRGFVPIHEHLTLAAKLELMGKKETKVGKHSSGSLGRHLRRQRQKKLIKESAGN